MSVSQQPPPILKAAPQEPKWLTQMRKYEGQPCMTGLPATAFITDCFRHTNYGEVRDTPPACAAILNRCLEEVGIKGTNSAAAQSFADWGRQSSLRVGAIIIFQWANGEHHVTICESLLTDGTIICLGGNQSHRVQKSAYSDRWVEAVRWPLGG